jgi:hypothetical protein
MYFLKKQDMFKAVFKTAGWNKNMGFKEKGGERKKYTNCS